MERQKGAAVSYTFWRWWLCSSDLCANTSPCANKLLWSLNWASVCNIEKVWPSWKEFLVDFDPALNRGTHLSRFLGSVDRRINMTKTAWFYVNPGWPFFSFHSYYTVYSTFTKSFTKLYFTQTSFKMTTTFPQTPGILRHFLHRFTTEQFKKPCQEVGWGAARGPDREIRVI